MKAKFLTHVICVSLGVPLAAHADDHKEVDELVISIAPADDLLQSTQVLTGDELLIKSAPTIGETLANEPGVSSSYFGPASSRPIIRGLSGSRVSILSDGAATLDVSDVSPDHAVTVESILADQVEIIRGPATLLYGSSAAGGIVNVTDGRIPTKLPEQTISGIGEVRGDTATEEQTIVGRLDGALGNIAWHVDAFDRETENIDIDGFATADPAARPDEEQSGTLINSYSETDGYALGLSWIGSRGYLGASISELDSTYGLPGPEVEEGEEEPALFEGPFLDLEQTRVDVRGELQIEDSFVESLKFVVGVNDYEHVEIEPSGEVATTFNNDQWQSRIEATHQAIGNLTGTWGLQFDNRELESVGEEAFITPTETDAIGLFLVEEFTSGSASYQFSGRLELLEHSNTDFAEYDENAWSFAGGVRLPHTNENEFIINLSRTERNPNAEELYSNGAHIATRQFEVGLLANGADADKEVALNYEFGIEKAVGEITWDAWIYYYDYSDYVFQDITGNEVDGLAEAIYRQDDAEFMGLEAAISFPLWQSNDIDNDLRVFGDYVDAELDNGQDLPRLPPWRLGANSHLVLSNGKQVLIYLSREQNDISSSNTDDYTMLNASFLYRLDFAEADLELFLRGTNLLDEDARKSTSFIAAFAPLPGASLTAGIRGKF